tara:strand:- start:12317 stop:13162 length:846 start_codon:yes stop_codon:yes gene_type:complete
MDPKLAKELDEFNKRKDDVFKNINLLNSLSESLVNSISEEESKIIHKKNKEIIENEKKKTANELELLGLENSKMESYLEILSKKQDLELKYLEQMCDQNAKIHKLGEKYSFLDITSFLTYDTHYKHQVKDASYEHTKKNLKKGTTKKDEINIEDNSGKKSETQPPPPSNLNPPSNSPFPRIVEEPSNAEDSDFELANKKNDPEKSSPDGEPPPRPPPPPIPSRRATVASPEGISKKESPIRRPSLQDQLKAALADKFALAGTSTKPPHNTDESDSDGSSWS